MKRIAVIFSVAGVLALCALVLGRPAPVAVVPPGPPPPPIVAPPTPVEPPVPMVSTQGSILVGSSLSDPLLALGSDRDEYLKIDLTGVAAPNGSQFNLTNAFLTYSFFPTNGGPEDARGTLTFGQQLVPFGLEAQADEEVRPVINSAQFSSAFNGISQRQIGLIYRGDSFVNVDYTNNYRQALLEYAVGVVNGAGSLVAGFMPAIMGAVIGWTSQSAGGGFLAGFGMLRFGWNWLDPVIAEVTELNGGELDDDMAVLLLKDPR